LAHFCASWFHFLFSGVFGGLAFGIGLGCFDFSGSFLHSGYLKLVSGSNYLVMEGKE